jgi:beta-glucuronidase
MSSAFPPQVPPSSSETRELLVLADDRFNSTTAPTHTGGDFWNYGGITRDVILHEVPAAKTFLARVS